MTNALGQTVKTTYNSCDGSIASVRDQNDIDTGRAGTVYTYDALQRVTSVSLSDGGNTSVNYGGTALPETITTTTTATPSPNQISTATLDGMGRTITTLAPSGATVATSYDSRGRVHTVSNPYFTTADSTFGKAPYTYDGLNRITALLDSDSVGTQKLSYSGNTVTFTDEDGNQWQRTSDGLGRLTQIMEPSGGSKAASVKTGYAYDSLNNLITVTQNGDGSDPPRPVRGFSYDGLSRLISANNPETGITTYTYDSNSNVKSRTDARNIVTSYWYDALNRLTSKTYGIPSPAPPGYSSTPWPRYVYDTVTIGSGSGAQPPTLTVGRLARAYTTSGSSTITTDRITSIYDPVGRSLSNLTCLADCLNINNFPSSDVERIYDLAGNITGLWTTMYAVSIVTPIQSKTTYQRSYTRDLAGRLKTISALIDTCVNPHVSGQVWPCTDTVPVTLFAASSYGPIGLTGANLAADSTGLNPAMTLTRTYDNRGRVLTESNQNNQNQKIYNYSLAGGYDGVGNVIAFNDSVMGQWGFRYDSLNRLLSANVASGSYAGGNIAGAVMGWTYDSFGNRKTQSTTMGLPTAWATPNVKNQIVATNTAATVVFDAVGNVLDDGNQQYKYDAENRVCAVYRYHTPVQMTQYIYDALGNRIAKGSMSVFNCDRTTNGFAAISNYVNDHSGEQLDENDGTGTNLVHSNVSADGRLLATYNGSAWLYSFNDWLGTKRAQISSDGNLGNLSTFASLSFGDGLYRTGQDAAEQHFTGKERDAESGLDYFGARYYASNMGRFMSPDPSRLSVDFQDPQTWNRYTYVLNRPLTMIDRNGKWPTEIHNEIIDNAFPNLSNRQRQILKDISAKQDSLTGGGQGNSNAYQHAMRNSDQTVAQAKAEYDNYVANQGDMAQDAQMDWYLQEPDWPALSDEALGDFGKALHAVLDSTSPAHEGFQLWNWQSLGQDKKHVDREATISPMQMRRAVAAARSQFNNVFNRFGFQAFQDEPVYVVTSRIIY